MNRAILYLTYFTILSAAFSLTGCKAFRIAPKMIPAPSVAVDRVELVEVTDAGARLLIHLTLTSTSNEPLPLIRAAYTLNVGSAQYVGNTIPNATLPKFSTQSIALPAAITGQPADTFSVSGSITYQPPGEIRGLMTDVGIPLPSVTFSASGDVTGQPQFTSVLLVPIAPQHTPATEQPIETPAPQPIPIEQPALTDPPTDQPSGPPPQQSPSATPELIDEPGPAQ